MRGVVGSRVAVAACAAFLALASAAAAQPFAYVVGVRPGPGNRGLQVLTVIDIPTRARVAAIPLGDGCLCVMENAAVSADGTRIYVSNFWANTVSVVDTATNAVVQTLPVQPFPGSLTVSPDGSRLYVNTVLSPTPGYVVQVLDTASGATVATIPLQVPQSGSGMAMAPDGTRLYVTNQALNGSNVKVIDLAGNAVVGTVALGPVPRGIDVTPDGLHAYVAVQEANVVSVIDTGTQAVVGHVPAGTRPTYVRVLPNGSRAYATAGNTIITIATATRAVVGSIAAVLPRVVDFTPDSTTGVVAADQGVYFLDTAAGAIVATLPFAVATEGNPNYVVVPQVVPPPPDPPTDLTVASVVGNRVTLRWRPAPAGSPPRSYVVEGGVSPGQVLASLNTGSASPTYTFEAPTGAFHVRLHATGLGGRSAASNEVRLVVGTVEAPSAPASLLGLANGASLRLAWRNTFEGGVPSSLVLAVSGAATLSLPLGLTESFAFDGVPPGTYTFSVGAANAFGVLGPLSNAVTLTFPAVCSGPPQAPANVLAYREGRTVVLLWDPPASGPAADSYVIDVTGAFIGSVATSLRTVRGAVGPGTYSLSVASANQCGTGAAAAAQLVVVP